MTVSGLLLYKKLISKQWRFPDDFPDALDKINAFTVLLNDWYITLNSKLGIITFCYRIDFTEDENIYEEIFNMFGTKIYNQAIQISETNHPELFPKCLYDWDNIQQNK